MEATDTQIELDPAGLNPVLVGETTEVLTIQRLRSMCQPGVYEVVENALDDEGRACIQVLVDTGHRFGGRPVWTYYADPRGRLYRKL